MDQVQSKSEPTESRWKYCSEIISRVVATGVAGGAEPVHDTNTHTHTKIINYRQYGTALPDRWLNQLFYRKSKTQILVHHYATMQICVTKQIIN